MAWTELICTRAPASIAMSRIVNHSFQLPSVSIETTPSAVCARRLTAARPLAGARSAVSPSGAASRQSAKSHGRALPESSGM